MTADDLRPCKACGAPCDGGVCDTHCELELMHQRLEQEMAQEEEEEEGDA
jgi:hypothetical protein